jgi:hypothetical protein
LGGEEVNSSKYKLFKYREVEKMNTEEMKTESKDENTTKIPITKEAEKLFSEIVDKVNAGFEAGRLVRRDVASWIISRFSNRYSDADIKEMRQDHLSEDILLESFYRKMKDLNQLPPEVRKILLSTLNVDDSAHGTARRRGKNVPAEDKNEAAS